MSILKELSSGEDCKSRLIDGVNKVADVVTSTYGYRGRYVGVEQDGGLGYFCADGYDVIKSIHLEDPVMSLACETLKESARKTASEAGDSSTLATLLAQAFINHSDEALKSGKPAIDIKLDIEKSRDKIIKFLDDIAIESNDKILYDIAKTSTRGDEKLAEIIHKAFVDAGENGSVGHFRSNSEETYLDYVDGSLAQMGYADPFYVTNHAQQTIEYDNPLILFSNIKFASINQLVPFVEFAMGNGSDRPLVIVSDTEFQINQTLLQNKLKGKKIALVNPPSHSDKRRDFLFDLSLICNTQPITSLSGVDFTGRAGEYLGECKRIVVGKTDTVIYSNDNNKEAVDAKIHELKERFAKSQNPMERSYLIERIAILSSGASLIKVGAHSESELKEKISRVEDAVLACKSTKEQGAVAGGATALLKAHRELDLDGVTKNVLIEPITKLLKNGGLGFDEKSFPVYPIGKDLKSFQDADMFDIGIVDSVKAIKSALENAVSVANVILMTDNAITFKRANNG